MEDAPADTRQQQRRDVRALIGLGGITSYTDVLEFMICGARAVQVGTANFTSPTAAYDIARDLAEYVKQNDIDINDLVGSLILNG